jgi:RimJ/RimL family protein N-acetyltransferase
MPTTARWVALPSGREFDLLRPRSHGVLDAEEREYCARANIPIGYDPAQLGWVTLLGEDDIADVRDSTFRPAAAAHDSALDLGLRITQLRERFDVIARPVVEQMKVGLISPVEAEARLWTGVDLALGDLRFLDDVVTLEKCYTEIRCEAARTIAQFRGPSIDGPDPVAASCFTFRPWQPTDVDIYRRYLDNPKLWAFVPEDYPSPFTEDTARVLIEASRAVSHHEVLAAELDGEPVGQVRLLFDDSYPGLNAAEVSYWIAEEYWGKSLGTTILRIFTDRSFRERPLDLIYAWIRTEHVASIKTAERAGYRSDPFLRLSSFAGEMRRAGCGRWICFRSDCIAAIAHAASENAAAPGGPPAPTTVLRRGASTA